MAEPSANTPRALIKEVAERERVARERLEKSSILLNPEEVRGDYDAKRALETTLGGQRRAITLDDLRQFKYLADRLGRQFKGGITPKQVIDLSLPADRQRSNEQIKHAAPLQAGAGKIHFVTNAGPDSNVSRHHVHVEFLVYPAAVASPVKPETLASELVKGRVRFRCDCGRFRFWYSYIATIGGFIHGDRQVNFPKIRNPNLSGVACKHALRVMQEVQQPAVRKMLADMITRGRGVTDAAKDKMRALKKAEVEAAAREQAARTHWQRAQVETTTERADRLAQARAMRSAAATPAARSTRPASRSAAQVPPAPPRPPRLAPKAQQGSAVKAAQSAARQNIELLVRMGALTAKAAEAMLKKLT